MNTFDTIQTELENRFGLSPRNDWQVVIERAATELCDSTNIPMETFLRRITYDIPLLKQLAGRMTISESFFFRHPEQLNRIASHINQQLQQSNNKQVLVWSAGCSGGEEPLSLAILLKETLLPSALNRVSIIGNDIDESIIDAARAGNYSAWSFRGLSKLRRRKYFTETEKGRFQISPEIRNMVAFEPRSIQEQISMLQPSSVDVIMFRNVGIYLTSDCIRSLHDSFCTALKEGGLLCLAPSDPTVVHSELKKSENGPSVIYRKNTFRRKISELKEVCVWSRPATDITFSDTPEREIDPALLDLVRDSQHPPPPVVENRDEYINQGRTALDSDESISAESVFREAVFSNPIDPEARFWYAVALFEAESHNRSKAQLNALLYSLRETDLSQTLSDGQTTVRELIQHARSLLERVSKQYGD